MNVELQKTQTGWAPANDAAMSAHARQKLGAVSHGDFKQFRNYRFHKKYFALLNLAFDYWETADQEYKGMPVTKNFDRFRADVQIVAGYGDPVFNLRGEIRMESKSISFGSMTQDDFDDLYNKVVNVLLDRVLRLKGFTRETIDELVEQLTAFA